MAFCSLATFKTPHFSSYSAGYCVFKYDKYDKSVKTNLTFDLIFHIHNIPTACLLNRSPVPAMELKSNRSGL